MARSLIDLFTCGDICSPEPFDALLSDYLKPQAAQAEIRLRINAI